MQKLKGLYINNEGLPVERNHIWYSPDLNELITMLNSPVDGEEDAEYDLVVGNMLYIPVFYIGTL